MQLAAHGCQFLLAVLLPLAFFVDKAALPVQVVLDGQALAVEVPLAGRAAPPQSLPEPAPWGEGTAEETEAQIEVPLVRLAWARSGDKGNSANIGVIARRPEWLPLLWARLTPRAVQAYLAHLVHGPVERFHLPGISAMNFLLHEALDGGGPASRRMDPLGKGLAQILLDMPVRVPASWLG